jgi:YidC/Oxa1 family membrane protein insertase
MALVPLPSQWLGLDLARPNMLILPILVAASTWLQQKLTMPASPPTGDAQSAQMQQSMTVTMPLMFGFFAMQMPAGLSIYFIVSNLAGIGIQWLTNRMIKDDKEPTPTGSRRPSVSAGQSSTKQAASSDSQSAAKPSKSNYRKRGYRKRK